MKYVRWHSGAWIRPGLVGRDNDAWLWVEIHTSDEYRMSFLGLEDVRRVVDIGASIGVFAAYARQHFPDAEIIAVDPNTRTHELLELNAGEFATIIHGAVWHGTAPSLHRGDYDYQATVLDTPGEPVSVVSLAELLSPYCDLLKMDCEGCEYGVLEHEDLSRVHYILGEWHTRERWVPFCRKFLDEHPEWTCRNIRDSENGIFLMSNLEYRRDT